MPAAHIPAVPHHPLSPGGLAQASPAPREALSRVQIPGRASTEVSRFYTRCIMPGISTELQKPQPTGGNCFAYSSPAWSSPENCNQKLPWIFNVMFLKLRKAKQFLLQLSSAFCCDTSPALECTFFSRSFSSLGFFTDQYFLTRSAQSLFSSINPICIFAQQISSYLPKKLFFLTPHLAPQLGVKSNEISGTELVAGSQGSSC